MEEVPQLRRLHSQYQDKGFHVLSVTIDQTQVEANKTIAKKRMNYPVLYALKFTGEFPYHADSVPLNVLIDKWGVIAYRETVLPEDIEQRIQILTEAQGPVPAPAAAPQ